MSRFRQLHDGEWFFPARKGHDACCDCGLVHDVEYRLVKTANGGRLIAVRYTRNRAMTKSRRRTLGVKLTRRTG